MSETEIKVSLNLLLDAIKRSDGPVLAAEMARLDDCVQRQGMALHPQLLHFLGNRSYAKALMFLGGEQDIPVGVCGGRHARPAS